MNELEHSPPLNDEVWDFHGPDLRSVHRAT
jgi:hypothetical protein